MQLLSINIGSARTLQLGARSVSSGIDKASTARAYMGPLGLAEDVVVDQKHHGGPDQAVYVYSAEDYAWWGERLGQAQAYGTFGENLTFSSFGPGELRIGDRYRVGVAELEVTAPRIPCSVFAHRMKDPQWVRKFQEAGRPGFYARVLQPGEVRSGDPIEKVPAPEAYPTLLEVYRVWFEKSPQPETLQRILAAPIAARTRANYQERLRQAVATPEPNP